MLIERTNPKGIDWYIAKLQRQIHNRLIATDTWNLASDQYRAYGRCYRNKTDDGYVAENYEANGEYREVYWDDSISALSFFGVSGSVNLEGPQAQASVHLVFFVNLAKVAPGITHRADEEVRRQVIEAIGASAHGFQPEGVELWLENVLREYPGSRRDNRLKFIDMHPIHCFRINFNLIFNPLKTC